ncbi:MAG: argininosuccinate synthase-related protein [Proteobacteria bacterium]|nr:argininosuccinate synthase-related protein [Pseudomonadota bacterium]
MNFHTQKDQTNSRIISSFGDIEALPDRDMPVVTMFSGGLDSTYLLLRLQQAGFRNVEAVAVNMGEPIDAAAMSGTAARFGARFTYLEARDLFIEKAVKPAIRAQAKYHGMYPLSSSLSRPVIAETVVRHASALGSTLLLHTANLSQNSLPRLNNSIVRFGFKGAFGSPYVYSALSRERKAEALAGAGLSFIADRRLSGDENLWCREFESGPLDDPEDFVIPEDSFRWTRKGEPPAPEELALRFEDGALVAVDGKPVALIDAIAALNTRVGRFGFGRYVGLEHIASGEKVLEVREAPAAMIIMDALRLLECASLSAEAIALKQKLEQDWVQEAIAGRWGGKVHAMCEAAIASALEGVGGSVTYMLDAQRFMPRAIVADRPVYIRDRDLWEYQKAKSGCAGAMTGGA